MKFLQMLKNSISSIYVNYIKDEEIKNLPIFYIGGSQNLPPPLNQEEERIELEKLEKRR